MLRALALLVALGFTCVGGVPATALKAKNGECGSDSKLVRLLEDLKLGERHFEVEIRVGKIKNESLVFMANGGVYISTSQGLRTVTTGGLRFDEEVVQGRKRWKVQKAIPKERERQFVKVARLFLSGCAGARSFGSGYRTTIPSTLTRQETTISLSTSKADKVPWVISEANICHIPGLDIGVSRYRECAGSGIIATPG